MEKIAIVSTLGAPLRQTLSFVRYHLHIGIDEPEMAEIPATGTGFGDANLCDPPDFVVLKCEMTKKNRQLFRGWFVNETISYSYL